MQIASRPTIRRSLRPPNRRLNMPRPPAPRTLWPNCRELGELKAQGILTEEEFAIQKARILA